MTGAKPDDSCIQAAAQAIANADFLLLASGAGLSADSGLATFATMTAQMGDKLGEGVTHDHAAGSDTMAKDPELFYAFWFSSLQNYLQAEPHAGYDVLRSWRERVEERAKTRKTDEPGLPEVWRPVFSMTSNVDGWSLRKQVAHPDAFSQIHGTVHKMQCGGVPSGKRFPTWSKDRCCNELFDASLPDASKFDFDAVPLRYTEEVPRCPRCKEGWLRPNVYLFGDGSRFNSTEEITGTDSQARWKAEVHAALRANSSMRLVIVEIGCGLRVPNIRKRCEEFFAKCPSGQCELIRINPESSDTVFAAAPTVFVKDTALSALQRIDARLCTLPE